jgi:hypothetical protein
MAGSRAGIGNGNAAHFRAPRNCAAVARARPIAYIAAFAPHGASPMDASMADDPRNVPGKILVGKSDVFEYLNLPLGNRHGLVTGATGTGKTVSLQVLAEGFSNAGVRSSPPTSRATSRASPWGDAKPPFVARAQQIGVPYVADSFPSCSGTVRRAGPSGPRHRLRDGPAAAGPHDELNETQEGVLNIAFRVADETGPAAARPEGSARDLQFVADNAAEADDASTAMSPSRPSAPSSASLLVLENQGGDKFFGEPALDIKDFMRTDKDGRGMINILAADKLMRSPRSTPPSCLWMLSELFEAAGSRRPDKPKLVFFFDEAHLLFDDAPKRC